MANAGHSLSVKCGKGHKYKLMNEENSPINTGIHVGKQKRKIHPYNIYL